ncbi:hypothetical protein AAGG74_16310 [Bacillus mexicanus]|uniref:hypothetical protein n=1 Tax=Bacillus mexicanus TaxID=2834415 RepID=UPI003D1FEE46
MKKISERERLMQEAKDFVSFPPVDLEDMTNEEIRKRNEIIKKTFEMAFGEEGGNDDI